jgi:chaperone BCS1
MLDIVSILYLNMISATKDNPLLAPLITLTILGGVSMILRRAPTTVIRFGKTQLTTSVSMHNAGHWGNRLVFLSFLAWYTRLPSSKWSRRLSVENADNDSGNLVIGPGYGLHFFWFNQRIFWFYKSALESGGAEMQKQSVEIFTYGRSRAPIEALISSFKPTPKAPGTTEIHSLTVHGWHRSAVISDRPLESVVVEPGVLEKLLNVVDDFYNMRDWYTQRGVPHKICILLHGVPGTGKTSLIKALAGHYGVNIYKMNINQLSDESLEDALSQVPKGNLVLLEDVDSSTAVQKRVDQSAREPVTPEAEVRLRDKPSGFEPLSLTGVLNAFDGVIPLDNTLLVFTTNHLERLDPAMIRPGRVDVLLELGAMKDAEIKRYVDYVYGKQDLSAYTFGPVAGCYIYSLLIEHKANFESFKLALIDRYGASLTG